MRSECTERLTEGIDGESFAEWHRERQWAQNIREGQPYFNGPSPVPPVEKHTPSHLLQCHRKLYYWKEKAPAEQEEPEGIFWTGNKFEEDVAVPFLQDVIGDDAYVRNSIWVDFEEETPAGTLRSKGETIPCIVDRQSEPLLVTEIKTRDEVDYLDEPNRHHRAQVHAYMRGLTEKHDRDIDEVIIIYGSRKTLTVRAFPVEFDPAFWREVVEWAADHSEYRSDGLLPPAEPEYGWECRFCDYRHRCGQSNEPYADEGHTGSSLDWLTTRELKSLSTFEPTMTPISRRHWHGSTPISPTSTRSVDGRVHAVRPSTRGTKSTGMATPMVLRSAQSVQQRVNSPPSHVPTREKPMDAEALAECALAQDDPDIEVFVERHGRDELVEAADYAFEYITGNVNHCIMAHERGISPLEAAIILETLASLADVE